MTQTGKYTGLENKEHLLFISPGFADGSEDTSCIPAMQVFLKELFSRNLFTISVISLHYPYKKKNYNWEGIQVFALGGGNRKGAKRLLTLQKALVLARRLNKKNKIHFIHSFWMGECAWLGSRLSKQLFAPHTCTLMGQDVLKGNRYFRKLNPFPELISLSAFHTEVLQKNYNIFPQHQIPWGVEAGLEINNKLKSTDLIAVGNLIEVKAHVDFIFIVKEIVKKIPELKVEIIGDGQEKSALKEMILKNSLSDNIKLNGALSRENTLKKIADSKVLVHTSGFESFGMVLAEALALGTAVFSTAVGIASETAEIHVFSEKKDIVQNITNFLTQEIKQKTLRPYKIEETVEAYLQAVFIKKD